MSASNTRIRSYGTCHHLISRIAHRVYFMTEEVRTNFLGMILHTADFCGIKLLSWCIMANHFHILAYLPEPEPIDENEILRRFAVLKGGERLIALKKRLSAIRSIDGDCSEKANEILTSIKARMYDIGVFMKIVKQWLTQEYNLRYAHRGTLWESVYKDVLVETNAQELAKRAGYIHLNPIRAAITPDFAGYPWSSYSALCRDDGTALAGMRFIYGEEASLEEIKEAHGDLMSALLEKEKFERALDIGRKRSAGYDVPADPLTDEALIVQADAHMKRVMEESVQKEIIKKIVGRPKGLNVETMRQIASLLRIDPTMKKKAIAEVAGISRTSVYSYLSRIKDANTSSNQ